MGNVFCLKKCCYRKDSSPCKTIQVLAEKKCEKLAVALYDLDVKCEAILKFSTGDQLVVEDDSDADWYVARHIGNQAKGFVPKIYLAIDENARNEDWFFGAIDRKDSERILLQPINKPGAFMIRNSRITGVYALSVKAAISEIEEVVRHYKIRTLDNGGFFITPSTTFPTLQALVTSYSAAANGLCCKLEKPCNKPQPTMPNPSSVIRDEYEIPYSSLKFDDNCLGKGNFGEVYHGYWNETFEVAIKRVRNNGVNSREFLREVSVMKTIKHPQIVCLYAVCTEEEPFCIVMEYMNRGNLRNYMRNGTGAALKLSSLVNIAAQIADGMKYLENSNLLHRDLAARNILVGENNVVKLADFGLARIMEDTIYVAKGGKFPIKWTAPEALYGKFSIKSDVWSYGVVLYEVFSHGADPYPGLDNKQVYTLITTQNYQMAKPNDPQCTDAVYKIMLLCWKKKPSDRPTFDYLYHFFTDYHVTSEGSYQDSESYVNS